VPAERSAPRPKFARSFPKDPTLDALVRAFEQGDYARVRKEAPELAKTTEDEGIKRAALELRRRIDPDPLGLALMALAAILLLLLSGYYWTHKQGGL
jgi:hypothetical protein